VNGAWVLDGQLVIPWYLYNLIKTPWTSILEFDDSFPYRTEGKLHEVLLSVPISLMCSKFYHEVVLSLASYAHVNEDAPNNTRIVFWFDN
jgi:hypothetical protein